MVETIPTTSRSRHRSLPGGNRAFRAVTLLYPARPQVGRVTTTGSFSCRNGCTSRKAQAAPLSSCFEKTVIASVSSNCADEYCLYAPWVSESAVPGSLDEPAHHLTHLRRIRRDRHVDLSGPARCED